jgi:outer membrane murein-binding lipoprotein Lpp
MLVIVSVALRSATLEGAQSPATHAGADASMAAKANQPPAPIAQLEARVQALEQELEALRKNGISAGRPVAHVERLPKAKGGKADSAEAMQVQINRLWDQMDLIIHKLDELADKR